MKIFLTLLVLTFSAMGFAQQRMPQPKNTTDVLMNLASNKGKHSITSDNYSKSINLNYATEDYPNTIVVINDKKIISLKELLTIDPKTVKTLTVVSDSTSSTSINRILMVETL